MSRTLFIILISVCISYSESSFLDSLKKCGINDFACRKDHYDSTLHTFAETGIPELGIPKLDPFVIRNQNMTLVGLFDFTFKDAVGEGLKGCKLESIDSDINKLTTKFDMACEVVTVKGTYNVKSDALMEQMTGKVVTGDGNCNVVIEKVLFHLSYPFTVERHDDGEIYIIPEDKEYKYTFEVLGKVTFDIDQINIGGQEMAPMVTSYLNTNWKYLTETFGTLFGDKAFSLIEENISRFFNGVPAKNYITDDLTQYVTK